MSLLHINYYCPALNKQSAMYVVLPEGEGPFPVVYQLHGLSDDYTIWLRRTSIERYAERYGMMVVMPDGDRGFYTDMQSGWACYEAHLLEGVRYIDRTFRTIATSAGRGIGGLSMGGYGAMKLGLKYPELFGSVAAHSGAMCITSLYENAEWVAYLQSIFGDTMNPADDCMVLAEQPGRKPALRFDCGTEDFLLEQNRAFDAHLTRLGIEHIYEEFPGAHDWEYWDEHIVEALRFHRKCFSMGMVS